MTTIPKKRIPHKDRQPKTDPVDDIPEEEKWRIINESGLMGKEVPVPGVKARKAQPSSPLDGEDFIFRAILYTIPFTTLFVLLHSVVYKQYGEVLDFMELVSQASRAAPGR